MQFLKRENWNSGFKKILSSDIFQVDNLEVNRLLIVWKNNFAYELARWSSGMILA